MNAQLAEILERFKARTPTATAPPDVPKPDIYRAPDGRCYVAQPSPESRRWGFPSDVPEVTPTNRGVVSIPAFKALGWTGKRLDWKPGAVAHIGGTRDAALALALWLAGELHKDPRNRPVRFVSARTFAEAEPGASWLTAPTLPAWGTLIVGDVLPSIGAQRVQQVSGLLTARRDRSVVVVGDLEIRGNTGEDLSKALAYDGARKVTA